jgi:Flp pilus assembly protein CpaB
LGDSKINISGRSSQSNDGPTTTPAWPAGATRRLPFYLLASLVLAILAGLMTYNYLQQLRNEAVPSQEVLVARVDLNPGESIESPAIEIRSIPEIILPEKYLTEPNQAIGRSPAAPIYANELINPNRLSGAGSSGLRGKLPDGTWAMVLPKDWLVSPIPPLVPGDRIDLLAYPPGEGIDSAGLLVSKIQIFDSIELEDRHNQLIIAVDLEQGKRLLFAHTNGYRIIPLLPAEGEES